MLRLGSAWCLIFLFGNHWISTYSEYLELKALEVAVITIPANETVTAWVKGSFVNLSFIQVQLHTQFSNIFLSSKSSFSYTATKTGTSVGMIEVLKPNQTNVTWYIRAEGTENLTAVYYLDFFYPEDPLPGGCNQIFNLEVDPSIVLLHKLKRTDVWFQWANLAVQTGQEPIDCELQKVQSSLTYDVYAYFLQARDQSQGEFIDAVKKMLSASDIVKNGMKIFSESDGHNSKSLLTVTSEANQGAIYSVVVTRKDTGRQAAYVTAVTYSCDFQRGECTTQLLTGEIVVPIILACFGLFLTILGHSFFKTTQFLFGYIFTSLLLYIVMSIDHSLGEVVKLPVSLTLGLVGGLLWWLFWWYFQFQTVSVFLAGLCTGYLVAAVLFFTPFGNIEWWTVELNYSLAFVCAILFFTVALMAFSKLLSITSCSIVGGFMFVMAFGVPLRSSVRNIFLNSIYHQTLEDYLEAKVVFPCHSVDIALFTLWPVVVILSMVWQYYREKGQQKVVSSPAEPARDEEEIDQDSDDVTARLLTPEVRGYGAAGNRSNVNVNLVT